MDQSVKLLAFWGGRCQVQISDGTPTVLIEMVRDFRQSLKTNAGTESLTTSRRFLSDHFQSIIHHEHRQDFSKWKPENLFINLRLSLLRIFILIALCHSG
jgi:hypothetical protein